MKSVLTIFAVALAVLAFASTGLAQSPPCAAQNVFDLCKKNQDDYLATCAQLDYACLCRWNTVKLSCWDSCPQDIERGTQEALTTTYCSQPGANVTSAVSSLAPTTATTSVPLPSSSSATSAPESRPTGAAAAVAPSTVLAVFGTALMVAFQTLYG